MIKPYFYYCIWKSHTIFRHDNHLLMAKYGLGCQAQVFQSILERGRCSACSTAFCLSGELWNTSPTYRCSSMCCHLLFTRLLNMSISETTIYLFNLFMQGPGPHMLGHMIFRWGEEGQSLCH